MLSMKKFLRHPLVTSILFWLVFMVCLNVSYILGSLLPGAIRPYGLGVFGTIFALLITYAALRLDRKQFRDIGLRWERMTLLWLFGGFVTGAIIFGLIIGAIVCFTPMTIRAASATSLLSALVFSSFALIPQAWMEEIAFRSYTLRRLQSAYGVRFTIYIGGLAFAMYHFIPGGNLIGAILGTGIWGLAYGFLAVRSGGIAFPTGVHFALNLSQALFGMKEPYSALWNLVEGVPTGPFNLETDQVGLITQLLVLVITVMLTELYIRRHTNREKN